MSFDFLQFKRKYLIPVKRRLHRALSYRLTLSDNDRSERPLAVVIPVAGKDLPVFPYCIQGLRKNLRHPIKNIHIVAPKIPEIVECCKELECQFVDEREVLPEGPEGYNSYFSGREHVRSGWIYQQFLKLQIGQSLGLEKYLVYDSDTVLINPFKYEFGGKWVLEYSDGYRSELDRLHEYLLNGIRLQPYSFMCHAMVMDTNTVQQMHDGIESLMGRDWKEGIMQSLDLNLGLFFSEYELYGNYACHAGPSQISKVYWFNKALPRSRLQDHNQMENQYKGRCRTLSYHSYKR